VGSTDLLGETKPPEASGDLIMKYVPVLADVVTGDVVVTSGLDRIYPKGLMVGRVHAVSRGSGLFKEILLTPSAGFDRLELVMVVRQAPETEIFEETLR
jgi:rod shape-determining protein MreC